MKKQRFKKNIAAMSFDSKFAAPHLIRMIKKAK